MTITQTIKIPDDYRIFLELPRSFPSGVMAKVDINIPTSDGIDGIRQLLQKEMEEKGTASIKTESGDGWETHVREQYAKP